MLSLLLASLSVAGIVLPTGTELELRLRSKVASNVSKPQDAVEAVLIRPVVLDGEIVVPAGVAVRGEVKSAAPSTKPEERALLEVRWTALGAAKIDAKLTEVDNARESVDETGRINGILASETLASRMDRGVDRVQKKYSKLGGFLDTVRAAVFKDTDAEIVYEAGVEMTAVLIQPAQWNETASGSFPTAVTPEDALYDLVNAQPWQTTTEGQPVPSDITNLMFLGSEEQLTKAFEAAGWASAAGISAGSKLEVVRAVAESRGYKEAPMSILLLDGKKPDLVFQKQNNTFAMRHHLRIWKRPADFAGAEVWVCAATHDTGIELSPEKRNFIHKIDSQIDRERGKVVSDLVFAGRVKAVSLVARPEAPKKSRNATGDDILTDGAMAVLALE